MDADERPCHLCGVEWYIPHVHSPAAVRWYHRASEAEAALDRVRARVLGEDTEEWVRKAGGSRMVSGASILDAIDGDSDAEDSPSESTVEQPCGASSDADGEPAGVAPRLWSTAADWLFGPDPNAAPSVDTKPTMDAGSPRYSAGQVPCPHCAAQATHIEDSAQKASRQAGGSITVTCPHGRIFSFPDGWPYGWVEYKCGDAVRGCIVGEVIPCGSHYHKFDTSGRDVLR